MLHFTLMAFAQEADHEEQTLLEEQVNKNASGTSWQPVSSPMYMFHDDRHGPWRMMLHGNVFVGVDAQSSERGASSFESINQMMGMASRGVADTGWVGLRAMLSAEPLTVGEEGYPLLLQTGETADGEPLRDRQHPHDLFMELAATTRWTWGDAAGLELYVAPAGEPALGPTAFPHRVSAFSDPFAPLGHHWLDSTHISYGVVTAGVFTRWAKLEGSWFNGREPDEQRYDLDLAVPDSGSGRLTVTLGKDVALQASYGYLPSPEALQPGVSVHRVTGSATYNHPWAEGKANAATTAAWGRNVEEGERPTDSLLLETNVDPEGPLVVFGRVSHDIKSAHDLVLPQFPDEQRFGLNTASLGSSVLFPVGEHVETGLGLRGSVSVLPQALEMAYGTRVPVGVFVFAQIRPPPMPREHMRHLEGHGS
jgi:hypothetical protein